MVVDALAAYNHGLPLAGKPTKRFSIWKWNNLKNNKFVAMPSMMDARVETAVREKFDLQPVGLEENRLQIRLAGAYFTAFLILQVRQAASTTVFEYRYV